MATPLSEDRWRRLDALFHAAVDLPAEERAAFVARASEADPDLAPDLASMLASDRHRGERIAQAIGTVAADLDPVSTWIGRRVGGYRITREIGRGGMGQVFEAVRADDEFRKTVALKIMAPWCGTAIGGDRFRLERQILAGLEHPNIARFLDGGTIDGVPYFVMEHVDGVPITVACRERPLGLAVRIALFRQVCHAVQFAHERLIVHRDLKPANILVSREGVPKLLDFGVAKLLDPLAIEDATATIGAGWTPDYTSPEQVRGQAVTMRTDVYSLGLVLYELLTGERAQAADTSSPLALDRSVCETEPPLAPALRGDLDTIVRMAIRKEPDRRYGSAAALSDDLERYLAGRPVVARPNTARYRMGKFFRRHWLGATAAGLLAASVAAGVATTVHQARRAERRFQQVRALARTFVFDVHDQIATLPGSTNARKTIVQTGLNYLENLRSEAGGDAALTRELAGAYEKIARVQGEPTSANLGDTAGAVASVTKALDMLAPLADRGDEAAQAQIVSSTTLLGNLQQVQGHGDQATRSFARAEAIGERLLGRPRPDLAVLLSTQQAYSADALAASNQQSRARAEASGRRAMTLARQLVDGDPGNRAYRVALSDAMSELGVVLRASGRLQDGANSYREAIAIREQLVREDPENIDFRRELLVGYGHLGDVLAFRSGENLGDQAGAIAAFERASELAQWGHQRDPADRRAWSDLMNAKFRLGFVLAATPGRAADALTVLLDAERWCDRLRAQAPSVYQHLYMKISINRALADALTSSGEVDEAARRLEDVRGLSEPYLKSPNGLQVRIQYFWATLRLAMLRVQAGDPRGGDLADAAASQFDALQPFGTPFATAKAWGNLGHVNVEIARHVPPASRDARLRTAVTRLERSAALWEPVTASAGADAEPARLLAAVQADLAFARQALGATGR